MNLNQVVLKSAKNFSETINSIFTFAVGHIKPLSLIFLTYAIIPVLITGFAGININNNTWTTFFQGVFKQQTLQSPPNLGMLLLFLFANYIAYTIIIGMIYEYMVLYSRSEDGVISLSDVWQKFKNDAGGLFGYQLLLGLIIGIASGVIMLLIALLSQASIAIAVILGIVFAIGVIYISIPLSIYLMVYASEKTNFITTFKRSFELVKTKWWLTFGLIIIVGLIQMTMASIFGIPQFIYLAVKGFTALSNSEPSGFNNILMGVFSLISTLGSSWLNILLAVFIGIHYYSLVEQKDKTSLLNRIDSIKDDENDNLVE